MFLSESDTLIIPKPASDTEITGLAEDWVITMLPAAAQFITEGDEDPAEGIRDTFSVGGGPQSFA